MGTQLEQFLKEMRPHGDAELDLVFGCKPSEAYRFGLAPHPRDLGLIALSKAVETGVRDAHLVGDNRSCRLIYDGKSFRFGPGVFAGILKRGTLGTLNLSVNGRLLVPGFKQPLCRHSLEPKGRIVSGFLDFLGSKARGQVELVDRGVSFSVGPLFGPIRAIVRVKPLRGAPWPTRLVLNSDVASILRETWCQIRKLCDHQR